MRIAVNVRALIADRVDGIGRFTYEVFNHMTNAHQEHQFVFLFDRPFPREFIFSPNITPVVAMPCRHPILWYIWFEYVVPRVLNKHRADIFVSPDGFLSLATDVPSLPVMHDFSFHHYPDYLPLSISRYYNHFFPKYARKADLIATVSEFSKYDIARICRQPLDKIKVIYNGASSVFRPLDEERRTAARSLFAGGRPYFLYVGTLHPRKNIVRLIRAFDEFKTAYHSDTAMILAGPKMFKTADIQRAHDRMRHKADLIFAGPVSDEQLPELYGAALALTYIPVFEGFGLPIIEAMRSHVPVITSDCSSIPEVCDGAAIQVDPFSVDAVVKAMASVTFDENMRSRLIRLGSTRAECFSWQKTSTLLWECIDRVMRRTDG